MSRSSLESQDSPVLVDISDMKLGPTSNRSSAQAFDSGHSGDFVAPNDRFTMPNVTSSPQAEPKILVIGWVRTKSLLVWPAFAFSVLAVAISVLDGKPAHNAALGLAVMAEAAGVLSCLEVLMVRQVK
jgi:hypothetical protein